MDALGNESYSPRPRVYHLPFTTGSLLRLDWVPPASQIRKKGPPDSLHAVGKIRARGLDGGGRCPESLRMVTTTVGGSPGADVEVGEGREKAC